MSLTDKIEAMWRQKDFDPDAHRAILDDLQQNGGIASRSIEECVKAYNHLQNVVIYKTRCDNSWKARDKNQDGQTDQKLAVDESRYPDEISLLHQINERFQHSPALETWVSRGRRALTDELRDDNFAAHSFNWGKLSMAQKKDVLTSLVHRQMQKFAGDEFSFVMPEIKIEDDPAAPTAYSSPEGDCIGFNKKLLESPDGFHPLGLAFHESMHAALSQLSLLQKNGELPPNHPLYEDAKIFTARRENCGASLLDIFNVYMSDPEEKLAYSQQDRFNFSLYREKTLKSLFTERAMDAEKFMELNSPRLSGALKTIGLFPT